MKYYALIYCRVSSKKQEVNGGGLSSQEKRCRDYSAFHGYPVENIFPDSYTGEGDFMKRPGLKALINHIKGNPGKKFIVIFDDLKRFARDSRKHWELKDYLYSLGAEIASPNFEFKKDNEESWLNESINAVFNDFDRRTNRRQVLQKMKSRLERGIYCMGGVAPLGYTYQKNKVFGGKILTIHKREAHVIKEIYEKYASGELMHIKDVIAYIKTQRCNRGKITSYKAARHILMNILYTGHVEYPSWKISRRLAVHKPIITIQLFEDVQDRLMGKLPHRTRRDMSEDFPLRGLVMCAFCSKHLTASWSTGRNKKYPFYRCTSKDCPERNKSIVRDNIHKDFKNVMRELEVNEFSLKMAEAIIRSRNTIECEKHQTYPEEIKKQIEQILVEKRTLLDRITKVSDESILHVYESKIIEFHNKQIKLEDDLRNPQRHPAILLEPYIEKGLEIIKSPYDFYYNHGLDKQRLLIQTLFRGTLNYDRFDGFGTTGKCYVLRLFQEISAEKSLNSINVHVNPKTWNQDNGITHFAQSISDTDWLEIVETLNRLAEIANRPTDKD